MLKNLENHVEEAYGIAGFAESFVDSLKYYTLIGGFIALAYLGFCAYHTMTKEKPESKIKAEISAGYNK